MCSHLSHGYCHDDCCAPHRHCDRCAAWQALVDLLAALVLLAIFAFAWVQLR